MAGNTNNPNEIFSENDALDINELASLNEDFSPEFIEQLSEKLHHFTSPPAVREGSNFSIFLPTLAVIRHLVLAILM